MDIFRLADINWLSKWKESRKYSRTSNESLVMTAAVKSKFRTKSEYRFAQHVQKAMLEHRLNRKPQKIKSILRNALKNKKLQRKTLYHCHFCVFNNFWWSPGHAGREWDQLTLQCYLDINFNVIFLTAFNKNDVQKVKSDAWIDSAVQISRSFVLRFVQN